MTQVLSKALIGLSTALVLGMGAVHLIQTKAAAGQNVGLLQNDPRTIDTGQKIYADNCASCHGQNLEGEPNWRSPKADLTMPAPPHDDTGHTWHHSDEVLFKLTKYGLAAYLKQPDYKSNMPAYEDVLTDDEINAVLSFIKSRWSPEMREHQGNLK